MGLLWSDNDKTYNTTYTGLSDEQVTALKDKTTTQSQKTREVAKNQGTRTREAVRNQAGNTQAAITTDGELTREALDTGFTGVGDTLTTMGTDATSAFDTLKERTKNTKTAVDTGFADMATGFDGIAGNITDATTNINSGLGVIAEDLALGFDHTNTQLGGINDSLSGFSDGFSGLQDSISGFTDGFSGIKDSISGFGGGFTSLRDLLASTQKTLKAGQQGLTKSLATQGQRANQMYGGLEQGQKSLGQQISGVQGGLNSFTGQYAKDAGQANRARADLQSGMAKGFADTQKGMQTGFGGIEDTMRGVETAQSKGQNALMKAVGGVSNAVTDGNRSIAEGNKAVADGLGSVGQSVEGGFAQQQMAQQMAQQQFGQQVNGVRDLLATTGDNLDAQTRQQYQALTSSFDESGNLIKQAIDANGNTITREMDDQGNLLISRFDGQGNALGTMQLNVNDMLSRADQLKQQVAQQGQQTADGFASQADALSSMGVGIQDRVDDQGNLIRTAVDASGREIQGLLDRNGNLVSQAGQAAQQGFLDVNAAIADEASRNQQYTSRVMDAFDGQNGVMDSQVKDLASATSQMSNIDKSLRQEFYQLGNAFDDQGQLIRTSVDSKGNTIQRAVDEQGNLLIRAFDQTGTALGDRFININKALQDLSQQKTQVGGSTFMGGLTAPAQARPDGAAPVGGFLSPFTQTR